MSFKDSKLYSVIHETCPRCHVGKMFVYGPYQSLDFTQMYPKCSHCGQSFEPEPDFYQGAMYVSYGLSIGVSFAIGILMLFIFNINLWITTIAFTVALILLLPIIFRISRVIWLNFFVRYQPQESKSKGL